MKTKKPNILYVDDEYYNLTAFMAAFRHYYNIHTSTSAQEAMEILRKQEINLIITDQRMPDMTGTEFFKSIISEYPYPVRMILTGFSDVEAIRDAINSGAVLRYITKPWNEQELKQIIDMGILIHELEKNERLFIENLEQEITLQNKTIDFFKKYVPQQFLHQKENFEDISDKGEYRIISTLFLNIDQVIKTIESLESKQMISFLNSFFTIMINCIIKNDGRINYLLGNELTAIFDSSDTSPHKQKNAVFCALEMLEALNQFNLSLGHAAKNKNVIQIGISTGQALIARIVTKNSLNEVAIGETIDNAASLAKLTSIAKNTILIDEATYQATKDDVITEPWPSENKHQQNFYFVNRKK